MVTLLASGCLRVIGAQHGVAVGAAAKASALATDPDYGPVLSREFGMLTPENEMKWAQVHPERDRYDFSGADDLVAFAEQHDMAVRGHTLAWHSQNPGWLTGGSWTRDELISLLEDHIATVVGRYRGRIAQWDVVNEAWTPIGLRLNPSPWSTGIGADYLEIAFRAAHAADPDAQLFYNDYGIEVAGAKADHVYAMVADFVARGVPIHGVGLQMHVTSYFDVAQLEAQMARYEALGVKVGITEMDVRLPVPPTPADLDRQAGVYERAASACGRSPICDTLVLWGFTDRYSWVPSFYPGTGAALPFDEDYAEKPAYDGLVRGLQAGGP